MKLGKALLLLILTALISVSCATRRDYADDEFMTNLVGENFQEKSSRMQWWHDAKMGVFLEWGLFSTLGGFYEGYQDNNAAWILQHTAMSPDTYEQYATKFNPVNAANNPFFQNIYNAGFRYVILTAKHHEGFSLFDSKYTDYDIVDASPYGKDLMAELVDGARAQNLKVGFYYSILDWHHPAQAEYDSEGKRLPVDAETEIDSEEKKREYIDYMKNQLTELIVNYDPEIIWLDGDYPDWWTPEDGIEVVMMLRNLKPSIIVNDRVGIRREVDGDFKTLRSNIMPHKRHNVRDQWELYISFDNTWGFNQDGGLMRKSPQDVVKKIVDTVSLGGNILVNVGPDMVGKVQNDDREQAIEIGKWLHVNSEAIYNTYPVIDKYAWWGRYTQNSKNLYYHLYVKPPFNELQFSVKKYPDGFKSAYFLADENKTPLEITMDKKKKHYVINLEGKYPETLLPVPVLVLEKVEKDAVMPVPSETVAEVQ